MLILTALSELCTGSFSLVSVISPESVSVLVTVGWVCDVNQTRYICHIRDMAMVIDVE